MRRHAWIIIRSKGFWVPLFCGAVIVALIFVFHPFRNLSFFESAGAPLQPAPRFKPVFSQHYPVHPRFLAELSQLRDTRLPFSEENLIHNFVDSANSALAVPSALLWCLLF